MKDVLKIFYNIALWLDSKKAYGIMWLAILAICLVGTIGVGFACSSTEEKVKGMEMRSDTIEMRLDRIEIKQDMMYDLLVRKLGE